MISAISNQGKDNCFSHNPFLVATLCYLADVEGVADVNIKPPSGPITDDIGAVGKAPFWNDGSGLTEGLGPCTAIMYKLRLPDWYVFQPGSLFIHGLCLTDIAFVYSSASASSFSSSIGSVCSKPKMIQKNGVATTTPRLKKSCTA